MKLGFLPMEQYLHLLIDILYHGTGTIVQLFKNLCTRAYFHPDIRDRNTVIQNVYRVLLTRSRKGMFLYFPQDPKLDETYQWFVDMLQIQD